MQVNRRGLGTVLPKLVIPKIVLHVMTVDLGKLQDRLQNMQKMQTCILEKKVKCFSDWCFECTYMMWIHDLDIYSIPHSQRQKSHCYQKRLDHLLKVLVEDLPSKNKSNCMYCCETLHVHLGNICFMQKYILFVFCTEDIFIQIIYLLQ